MGGPDTAPNQETFMATTIAELIEDRFGLPTQAGADLPAEGTVAQLLAHRTHRRYKPDPVPDDVLEIALAAALSAPSKSDLQQVGVVLVKDRARQATIGGWIPDMPWIATAPLFMVFCGDHRRIRRVSGELRHRPFPNDTLDMFMNAAVDAGLVLQGFITAAEALGLGCCPISVVRNHVEKLSELLELPAGVFPVAGLTVGYPSQAGWISLRLPPALTVHTDRYDDGDLAAQIDAYDRRREARHATPPASQRFVERYGLAEPYGWSEDKARQYSVPERHNFGPFIRRHGFGLA
jgi:nitroreductase/FMN reductase [NAD(P)H]